MESVVPDQVSEEMFWKNYFYQIELFKKQLGLPNRLTEKTEEVIDADQEVIEES
jgi:hypothetical protein